MHFVMIVLLSKEKDRHWLGLPTGSLYLLHSWADVMAHEIITHWASLSATVSWSRGSLQVALLAQVSAQLMTFRNNRMKEMAVVWTRPCTTFLLLSAVCLNLPATVFTPQGDHVIRSPSPARLSSCSSREGLQQLKERKQYKQSGGHNIKCSSFTGSESLVSPLFFVESHQVNVLFLLCLTPPIFGRLTDSHPSSLCTS